MPKSHNSILFLGLLSTFSLLTFDLYQPSVPFINNYFNISPSLGQLTLSLYLLIYGATHLLWGPLIDHFGRRHLLSGNLILALIASLMCAFALNITMLICGRVLQGFTLCCANLIAYSASRDFEDTVIRAKVLSYISMTVSISPIIAPVFGALIFHHFGWQANFIVMAIVAFILFIQSKISLLESPFWTPPQNSFSIKKILNEYKLIFSIPSLWCASFILMFSMSAVMLVVINSSYLIIDVLNYSPLAYGFIFILNGLNIIFGNYLGIWLRERLAISTTIYLGNWLIILGGGAMLITSKLYGFSLMVLFFSLISNLGISVTAAPT
ncbi:MFS transporter, partial [Legionella norrlandica]